MMTKSSSDYNRDDGGAKREAVDVVERLSMNEDIDIEFEPLELVLRDPEL